MPPLGSASNAPHRREASAYAAGNQRNRHAFGLNTVIATLAMLLILRNVFLVDYRKSTIIALKEAGKSDAEIDRLVPRSSADKTTSNQVKNVDFGRLEKEVALLRSEVEALKAIIEGNATTNGLQNSTKSSV
ncbi:hypothetical protein ACA910_013298 [Epithemia clementina (nom. ined.)]